MGADAYLRFMGRFSEPLAVSFADLAGVSRALAKLRNELEGVHARD